MGIGNKENLFVIFCLWCMKTYAVYRLNRNTIHLIGCPYFLYDEIFMLNSESIYFAISNIVYINIKPCIKVTVIAVVI